MKEITERLTYLVVHLMGTMSKAEEEKAIDYLFHRGYEPEDWELLRRELRKISNCLHTEMEDKKK